MEDRNKKIMIGIASIILMMLQILLALSDGERHGYAIMQEIERRSAATTEIGAGTLYRSVKQLLGGGGGVRSVTAPVDVGRAGGGLPPGPPRHAGGSHRSDQARVGEGPPCKFWRVNICIMHMCITGRFA